MVVRGKKVSEVLIDNYEELKSIFQKFEILEVRIFGSVACNRDKVTSDVDFLIKLPEDSTLLVFGQLKIELENLLRVPLDILTYSGLNESILKHFLNNSISLDMLPNLTDETAIKVSITSDDKIKMNLKSIVWVIERIQNHCADSSREAYMSHEILQDSVTRNIQLLGQIVSQISSDELEKINGIDTLILKGLITLKDALFMNVDHSLVWQTVTTEFEELKNCIQSEIEEREGRS